MFSLIECMLCETKKPFVYELYRYAIDGAIRAREMTSRRHVHQVDRGLPSPLPESCSKPTSCNQSFVPSLRCLAILIGVLLIQLMQDSRLHDGPYGRESSACARTVKSEF